MEQPGSKIACMELKQTGICTKGRDCEFMHKAKLYDLHKVAEHLISRQNTIDFVIKKQTNHMLVMTEELKKIKALLMSLKRVNHIPNAPIQD